MHSFPVPLAKAKLNIMHQHKHILIIVNVLSQKLIDNFFISVFRSTRSRTEVFYSAEENFRFGRIQ